MTTLVICCEKPCKPLDLRSTASEGKDFLIVWCHIMSGSVIPESKLKCEGLGLSGGCTPYCSSVWTVPLGFSYKEPRAATLCGLKRRGYIRGFRRTSQVSRNEKKKKKDQTEWNKKVILGQVTGQRSDGELVSDEQQAPTPTVPITFSFWRIHVEWFHMFIPIILCSSPVFPVSFWTVAFTLIWQRSIVSPALMPPPLMGCMCAVYRLPLSPRDGVTVFPGRVRVFHIFPFMFPQSYRSI